jgi:hypothetical protein
VLKVGIIKHELVQIIRMELQHNCTRVCGIYEEVHLWSYKARLYYGSVWVNIGIHRQIFENFHNEFL